MSRRQRSGNAEQHEVVAAAPLPFDRVVYLVHIAAYFIESWKDAVVFAGINHSARETVESWLWPETARVIVTADRKDNGSASDSAPADYFGESFKRLLRERNAWPQVSAPRPQLTLLSLNASIASIKSSWFLPRRWLAFPALT
jgi:hypothetical protein